MLSEREGRTLNEEPSPDRLPDLESSVPSHSAENHGQIDTKWNSWKTRLSRNCGGPHEDEQESAMGAYRATLLQADSELRCMRQLLERTAGRKRQLANFLCQFVAPGRPDALHKPRNVVTVNAPARISDMIIKTLSESQNSVYMKIREATSNVADSYPDEPFSTIAASMKQPQQEQCQEAASAYDTELAGLLAAVAGPLADSEGTIRQLLQSDLTGYGHNKRGMILFVNYRYDFPVANPLLLLAARWNFVRREEAIMQFVERKRKTWKKESAERFAEYKKEYEKWRNGERKLVLQANGTSSELRQQRRTDIYGRTASPKVSAGLGSMPSSPLLTSQMRKESVELDSDLLGSSTKPRLMTNPLEQYRVPDRTLWSRWEMQLFLEQYLVHPKDFMRIAVKLPHKTYSHIVQFYFDFKNHLRLMAMKKDKQASIHDWARELSKRLIIEKLALMRDDPHKQLFTIGEIKAMAIQRGKPTEPHRALTLEWAKEYSAKVGNNVRRLQLNSAFFSNQYMEAREKIVSLMASCVVKQQRPEPSPAVQTVANAAIIGSAETVPVIVPAKRGRPGSHRNGEKPARGAHWEPQEKEMFFKWFKVVGKDWKALRAKFPNKTDKQLRNFYQNNRTKLGADEDHFVLSQSAANNSLSPS